MPRPSPHLPPAGLPPGLPRRALRLGTRASALALAQSRRVAQSVTAFTGLPVDLVEITTYGDTSRERLTAIGGTGVFVNALREALLGGEVDFVVHSLKDLPTAPAAGIALAAVPPREDPRDALVLTGGRRPGGPWDAGAPDGAARRGTVRVGTGSPRRAAQLITWAARTGTAVEVVPVRGNVDTRLGMVRRGGLDGVVLAAAGLNRLGLRHAVTELLDASVMLPAPGQGALAVEARAGSAVTAALAALDHTATRTAVTAERAVLAGLHAGCAAPVAALATTGPAGRGPLHLQALVATPDGACTIRMAATTRAASTPETAADLGAELAGRLMSTGAADLLGATVH